LFHIHWREAAEFRSDGVLRVKGDVNEDTWVAVGNVCQNGNAVYFDKDSHSELQAAKFVVAAVVVAEKLYSN
jgi:hypothetical protein